ncbi:MAG TPA: RagB/SusD family nutrient uptake outer membrane protein [Sphingobacteriaceae bacterium]
MKTTYRKYFSLLLAPVLITVGACKKLDDIKPESTLTDAGYWNSTDDLKNASNYFYTFLPVIQANNHTAWSNEGANTAADILPVSDGSRVAPATTTDWTDNYRLIRACNKLLENSSRVSGDARLINRYNGEARFFRAWAYFNMVQRFGDVPLILRTFDIDDDLNVASRTPREEVLDAIYTDLDYAAANMYKASQLVADEYGRATSAAALALKARVALFAGTFNKYHNKGNANKHLELAVSASETLMNSGECALFNYAAKPDSSYYYLFRYEGEGANNKEVLLVRFYGNNVSSVVAAHNYTREMDINAGPNPTQELVNAYLYTDGLPKEKSSLYQSPVNTMTEFQNRDPRLGMTIFNQNHTYYTSRYAPGAGAFRSRKYFIYNAAEIGAKQSFIDNILIRYAEVLLSFAEAKYELNGSISDADLDKSINLLRARAKMPVKLTNALVTTNELNMRDEIRRERRVELATELDHAYWNLIRWKTAETELPKELLGRKYFPSEMGQITDPGMINPDGYIILQKAANRTFNPAKDYLWPLPTKELGINPNLVQNPGW